MFFFPSSSILQVLTLRKQSCVAWCTAITNHNMQQGGFQHILVTLLALLAELCALVHLTITCVLF